jgi:hypothetical protein
VAGAPGADGGVRSAGAVRGRDGLVRGGGPGRGRG